MDSLACEVIPLILRLGAMMAYKGQVHVIGASLWGLVKLGLKLGYWVQRQ